MCIRDSSDNVPGVQGVGPKTAMKLIQEHGNIENIYENIDSIKNEKMKDKLLSDKDNALLSKQLVTIITDVNIDLSVEDFEIKEMNTSKLEDIFKELEFSGLLKKIGSSETIEQKSTDRKKDYKNILNLEDLIGFVETLEPVSYTHLTLPTNREV